ncbi:2-polyprenyl-6-methoxyphenol hydroxylase-like FAD-dependent oxidoreductase [Nonomuraea fuscirosea]|uniref:2-polyprenyl-6-methoxyphenol hydroxylase-like FAD-dependent oxidoreductase n=1 Tax=Nonomuraea fuscirosea TaxID=1291556 RepID=A0A2T0N413_9ACTN|nr:FAD-dependent monooxygenase [Nonomuraea fuscirosea]PRX66919.1 2-polyprenyl-6-methoxyphenol hydroxylase-like FAD-dependent oxidoreductase [Nonomuraea fuscirosea]
MAGTTRGRRRKAIIVGGGIGGLATAVAFHRRGWQVEVLERAPAFTEAGAGLSIQPNGLRALDALGLGDRLRADGPADPPAGIRGSHGDWLIRNDVDGLKRRFGPWATVHRAALVALLRAAVPPEALRPGVDVRGVRPDGTVHHGGGASAADLVVGADGVHSVTRRSLWPELPGPRYVGYTTWRLIAPPQLVEGSAETWGRGERFGHVPMPDGRVYCYAMANAPAGSRIGLAELRERFARWHAPIPALLASADEKTVLQHDTYELPKLPAYVRGNVAVLGDAAHAMTPNLGQGACQALEDAVTLAHAVDTLGVRAGLAAYDGARRPRTQLIVRRSRQAGAAAHWTSTPLTTLRDALLPRLPNALFARSLTPAYDWRL